MASLTQGLMGKTVYANGSHSPTRGPVSAQGSKGYVAREQRKPNNVGITGGTSRVGGDGQSDTRSGIAAKALGRNSGTNAILPQQKPRPSAPPVKQTPVVSQLTQPGTGAPTTPGTGGGAPVQAQPPAWAAPTVQVKANGILELPYSEAWSQNLYDSLEELNNNLLTMQEDSQEQALQYGRSMRDNDLNNEIDKREDLNNASGRGAAFSSAYGLEVENSARDYNQMRNDLISGNDAFNQGQDRRRSMMQAAFQQQLARESLAYANELAANAGELGYGGYIPEVPPMTEDSNVNPEPNGPANQPNPGVQQPTTPRPVLNSKPVSLSPAQVLQLINNSKRPTAPKPGSGVQAKPGGRLPLPKGKKK